MEHLWLVFVLGFIAWHLLAMRKDISANMGTTTFRLSVVSEEEDELGISKEFACLWKKLNIPFSIAPGMELEDLGVSMNLVVERVVFNQESQVVYLRPKKVPLAKFEEETKSYIRVGWQHDH